MKRRVFLEKCAWSTGVLAASPLMTYGYNPLVVATVMQPNDLKISLAQWSLHRQFQNGTLNADDFAHISIDTYGINAVEYVNGFYKKYGNDERFWANMKARADKAGVNSLLIMVDEEGDLGAAKDKERKKAVENHYKWVNAAKILGCHSIRVNAFGASDRDTFRSTMADGLGRLSDYAAKENINIVIENHGLYSSDAKLITEIIQQVNSPNVGTLPDFGNWCLSAKWGSTKGDCEAAYDIYQGVSEFLPFAKGVSAKSYNFNAEGEHPSIDYHKMLKIVKDFGYKGHIGIEYEGDGPEHEGILQTKALIEKVWNSLD
ncbi:sugar phosphate isomerase/epimerase family protein [Flagellimonas myxillae]|uniref:sugar phosphate isomerase/epimerase family protein n=1 Tax=Flagellimonas myxillae TaxID=2942214 RepID=UPI00201EAD55|nr:sugar phosphate isomerase/epimerase family protein [Muricauda myxillae]MCL6267655.1 sugar phosphate isomerase/epimerase [Muricauda myxillae]